MRAVIVVKPKPIFKTERMKFVCPQGDFNAETAGMCPTHKVALQEVKAEAAKVEAKTE